MTTIKILILKIYFKGENDKRENDRGYYGNSFKFLQLLKNDKDVILFKLKLIVSTLGILSTIVTSSRSLAQKFKSFNLIMILII